MTGSRWPLPPAALQNYRETALRMKVQYATALIRWCLNWLNEVQDMTLAAALDGLAHTKRLRRFATALERVFEDAAIAEMSFQGVDGYVADGYVATLHSGNSRRAWQHGPLMRELIEQTVERECRRFPQVDRKTVRTIVTESMWQVHNNGRVDWRATDLRRAGVDAGEFSEVTPGRASIELRGPAAYTDEFGPKKAS